MKLPPGKIPIDILKDVVFKNLGATRSEVTLGPAAGVDGAVPVSYTHLTLPTIYSV